MTRTITIKGVGFIVNMKLKHKERLADMGLLLVAALWGIGFVATKDGLEYFPPFTLMALRFTISSILMYVVMFKWIGKIELKDLKDSIYLGLLSFGGFASQTFGLQFTTVSKQGLFTAMYVVIVPFLVWIIYKQAPKIRVFVSAFIAIIGIGLMSLESVGDFNFNIGDALTLVSAVFYAFIIIYIDKALLRVKPIKLTFLQLPFTAVLFAVVAAFTETMPKEVPWQGWQSTLYMAVLSTFICYVIQISCQKYTPPARASLLMSMESLFAVLFAVLLLGEQLSSLQIFGIAVLFSSVVLVEIKPSKKARFHRDKKLGKSHRGA